MLAVAAHQSDGRGALATQPQVHSLAGSPSGASDNLLISRQLISGGLIPPTSPAGDDSNPTRHLQLPLAASLTAESLAIATSSTTSSSVAEQLLGGVASTFNQMHQQAGPSNNSTLATAIAAATGHTSPLPHQQPPTLASFTGWEWLLITVLISIILISIIGNCLVCVAIFTDRRLRKLGNAFIVSLAIADLFVSCLVMTFALCNDLMNYWMFGEWFCDIWISFDIMCSTASILNLCAISLDRFIHIKDCLLYNQLMTKRVAISAVLIIWIISGLVSFVPINLGWHKPNHFKQASNATPGDLSHQHHLDLLAAGLADELAPGAAAGGGGEPRRVQLDDDQTSYEEALDAESKRLALIGHDGGRDRSQQRQDQAKLDVNERHKRGTGSETARRGAGGHPEWAEKGASEIRGVRSQIANKLHTSETFPSISAWPTGDGLQWQANLAAAAGAQVLNSGGGLRASGHHQGNNLSRGPTARSNDDGRGGGHDDDVRKQSRPDPLGLHKNELSDQVAAPLGEFNLVLPRQRAERRPARVERRPPPPPPKRIKHSRAGPSSGREAATPPEDGHWTSHGLESNWRLAGDGRHEAPRDSRGQTDQPNASSNVDNQNARRQDKILTKASRKRRQTSQSGTADEPGATRSSALTSSVAEGRRQPARAAQSGTSSIRPPDPAAPNELPQCMLTLTPTYAVISSTISFYIPCIIMLGLYSKLFACARRHVRNIKAISKAPQPIGFVASAENPATLAGGGGGSTIGRTSAPVSEAAANAEATGLGADSNQGEIINCRRPLASKRQDPARQLASSLLLSSSQTVTTVTSATANSNAARPTTNNERMATASGDPPANSLGSQCRAKLARIVRRPEPNLAPDNRSRTWIKFGRQPKGAVKSAPRAPKSELVESVLSSTTSKLLPQPRSDATQPNSQKAALNGGGLIMKLNNQQQNARSQTAPPSGRTADCNDAAAGLPNDNNNNHDHDETIAHGNETEPFLGAAHDAPERLHCRPEVDQTDRSSQLAAVSREDLARGRESSQMDDELNLSRATTIASATQILSATSNVAPFKSSFNASNNSHSQATSNLQQQQQRQHGGSWRKHQQSQQNKQQTNQLATHKAAITLGIIMGTFLFCWVPFFCLNIIKAFHGDRIPSSLFRAFTWLGYANSALNPIIYGIHNSEFRNAFNRIFFKHLTLKNGRQYLNRRFSYDLRPHIGAHQHHHEQTRWLNNISNQQNCAPTLEGHPMSQEQPDTNVARRHHH